MNRFDLEQAITQCFQTSEDIDILFEKILKRKVKREELLETLVGIKRLNDLRCEKSFNILEVMIKSGQV